MTRSNPKSPLISDFFFKEYAAVFGVMAMYYRLNDEIQNCLILLIIIRFFTLPVNDFSPLK